MEKCHHKSKSSSTTTEQRSFTLSLEIYHIKILLASQVRRKNSMSTTAPKNSKKLYIGCLSSTDLWPGQVFRPRRKERKKRFKTINTTNLHKNRIITNPQTRINPQSLIPSSRPDLWSDGQQSSFGSSLPELLCEWQSRSLMITLLPSSLDSLHLHHPNL